MKYLLKSGNILADKAQPIIFVASISLLSLIVAPSSPRAEDLVALTGNHAEAAESLATNGTAVAPDQALHMEIYLKPRNQAQLTQLLDEQQDPASAQYHKWLTPAEYAQQFGPSTSDVNQVSRWLAAQGFTITGVNGQEGRVKFDGDAASAQAAFNVDFAASSSGKHFGNIDDPQLPASLASKVSYLAGLDNFHANVFHAYVNSPYNNQTGTSDPYFGPNDIRTFNDETPLLNAGYNGSGQCIALSEGSDVDQASLGEFNTIFDLPAFTGSNFIAVYPDGQPSAPAVDGGGSPYDEAMLDIEYAHGIAPGATIVLYAVDAGNDASDPADALVDTVSAAVNDQTNNCATIAVSWAQCGESNSFYTNLSNIFSQGAAEGKSIFVATGDVGASELVFNSEDGGCVPTKTRGIEENAGSPYVTAVGASMFQPSYDNNGDDTSTLADTQQSVWNIDFNLANIFVDYGASTGGYSKIFPLPAWQKGTPGVAGKFRAVPDLVLGGGALGGKIIGTLNKKTEKLKITGSDYAAPYFWICLDSGYLLGEAAAGYECTISGGTSIVPPQYAGLFAIVAQKTGKAQGLINPALYAMAKANRKNPAAVGIVDITQGNNDYASFPGYSAKKGYDPASGWGSIDMNQFVTSYISAAD